ncbi:MAG: hypothetical protein EXS29_07145 [Pedosphaera sp.]|nr:hypothetical protein [Pedosphaera sp.]MST01070.1 hypothetical protein [Pedosphaera sp.]
MKFLSAILLVLCLSRATAPAQTVFISPAGSSPFFSYTTTLLTQPVYDPLLFTSPLFVPFTYQPAPTFNPFIQVPIPYTYLPVNPLWTAITTNNNPASVTNNFSVPIWPTVNYLPYSYLPLPGATTTYVPIFSNPIQSTPAIVTGGNGIIFGPPYATNNFSVTPTIYLSTPTITAPISANSMRIIAPRLPVWVTTTLVNFGATTGVVQRVNLRYPFSPVR